MGANDEVLGLKLVANTADFQAAFKQAETTAAALGAEVSKTTKQVDALGVALKKALADKKANDAAAAVFDQLDAKVSGLGDKLKGLGGIWKTSATEFNSALEVVKKIGDAFDKASELAHFAAEMQNLADRVPVERLRMMQDATEGAVAKADLMRFSMKALGGDMHVTEKGLDELLRAANTLGDKGFGDTMENAEKLMDALRKGSSRELKQFGLALDDTNNKAENSARIFEKIRELAHEDVEVNPQLKALERLQTAWHDALMSVKEDVGNLLMWLGSLFAADDAMDAVAQAAEEKARDAAWRATHGGRPDSEHNADRLRQLMLNANTGIQNDIYRQRARARHGGLAPSAIADDSQRLVQPGTWAMLGADSDPGFVGQVDDSMSKLAELFSGGIGDRWKKGGKGYTWWDAYKHRFSQADQLGLFSLGPSALQNALGEPGAFTLQTGPQGIGALGTAYEAPDLSGPAAAFFGGGTEGGAGVANQAQLHQFEKDLRDRTTLIGGGFDALSAGIGAAVDAAVTGSDNIGKAFLKASAMALKAIAIESAVRAAFELAMGIGTSVFSPADAGKHFAAAAQYGIAAALAGAGSAALGAAGGGFGGGGSASSAPGGGNIAPANSNAQQQQPTQIILQIGDGFVGKPDELAVAIMDRLNHATASGRGSIVTSAPGAVSFKR